MLLAFFYLPNSLTLSLLMGYGALILHLPLQVLPFRQTQTNNDAFIHRARVHTAKHFIDFLNRTDSAPPEAVEWRKRVAWKGSLFYQRDH